MLGDADANVSRSDRVVSHDMLQRLRSKMLTRTLTRTCWRAASVFVSIDTTGPTQDISALPIACKVQAHGRAVISRPSFTNDA